MGRISHISPLCFLTLIAALLFPADGRAGSLPLFFTNLTIENGLSSNVTNSIVQDDYGFVWIGTQEGLCRYDGYKMTSFQNNNTPQSISSNNISSLLNDGDHLWVGTWNGLCKINVRTFQVTRVNTGSSKVIRALLKDHNGNIWIGTSNGLLVYSKTRDEFLFYNTQNSSLTHNTIRCFYEADNGDVWVGTYDGINRYCNNNFTGYNLKGDYKPMLENNLICSILPFNDVNDSLLWVGTETGLALFNSTDGTFQLFNASNTALSNEVIKCIYRQNDSLLWLGTDFGLNLFNAKTEGVTTYYHDPLISNTIANNVVWEIYEDQQERLWLITSGGVSMVDNSRQYHKMQEEYYSFGNPRIGNQIKDLLVDRDGNIWMATIHGVIKKDAFTGRRQSFSTTSPANRKILLDNVYALEEDQQGRIWMGTAGGINIWDPIGEQMYSVTSNKNNGLISNYISGFAKQSDGTIWVSAWEGGLFKVVGDYKKPQAMKFVLIDRDGDGRFITTGLGVYYGSRNTFWRINDATLEKQPIATVGKALGNRDITAMMAGEDSDIWIGSENLLLKYNERNDSVEQFEINIGRPQKFINLSKDQLGHVWATSRNTIVRIDVPKHAYYTVPVNKNLPLKGFYNYCNAVMPDGRILFGGDNGYVELDPQMMIVSDEGPEVKVCGIFVNNQSVMPIDSSGILKQDIAFTSMLNLRYNQNSLTFEFSTLDYLFPTESQFRYRLSPHQEKWLYTSGIKNFAVFSNLKPGNYQFEVEGTNHLGVWSQGTTLSIHISPSIWLSKGFIALYFVVILLLTYFIFRVYTYRQRLRNELEIVRLENQHKELMYQAKIQFFTNISHEFRTPLSLILPPIRELLKNPMPDAAFEKMLRLASRNAQRLYKLVNQLLDFRKIESSGLELFRAKVNVVDFCREVFASFDDMAARHEIAYSFTSSQPEILADIDAEKVETIVFNLLSNAFKYSPYGGNIEVRVEAIQPPYGEAFFTITVKDSGIGIAPAEQPFVFEQFYQTIESKSLKVGSGIGLTLAMEYARLHLGTITLESEPGKGSAFTLKLPWVNNPECELFRSAPTAETFKSRVCQAVTQTDVLPSARRLLIIDDNDDILDFMEMNLKNSYQIYSAKNGQEGMALFEKVRPHLVISDIMMPVMDGFEVCAAIKGNRLTAPIPVILLTAKSLETQKAEGMERGADMYITKPFDIEYLKASIGSIFRRDDQLKGFLKQEMMLNPGSQDDNVPSTDDLFVQKVMTIIGNNLSNPSLSVEMIASGIGMSSTHLYRKLKEITGHSTKEIILNYRMQKAARLIEHKEGNITEIMYAVGFSSLSSFSKSFKTRFGVSPSDYKMKSN